MILADQSNVVYTDTLQQAIDQLVGTSTAPPPTNTPPSALTAAQVAQIASLVTQANTEYAAAYTALKAGDLSTYAADMTQVGKLLQQLKDLTAGAKATPGVTPTPSPSPSASPSP